MQDIGKLVGNRIREIRLQGKLTQEQVAEKAKINITYYGRVERGEANVSLELLAAISKALNTTIANLVDTASVEPVSELLKNIETTITNLPEDKLRYLYRFYQDILGG